MKILFLQKLPQISNFIFPRIFGGGARGIVKFGQNPEEMGKILGKVGKIVLGIEKNCMGMGGYFGGTKKIVG